MYFDDDDDDDEDDGDDEDDDDDDDDVMTLEINNRTTSIRAKHKIENVLFVE